MLKKLLQRPYQKNRLGFLSAGFVSSLAVDLIRNLKDIYKRVKRKHENIEEGAPPPKKSTHMCGQITKSGTTCKNKVSGNDYCWRHSS